MRVVVASSLLALCIHATALAAPEQAPRASAKRTTGIVLTTTGGVLVAGGATLALASAISMRPCSDTRPDCNTGNAFGVAGGTGIAVVGVPFLAVGIPLWVSADRGARVGVGRTASGGALVAISGPW